MLSRRGRVERPSRTPAALIRSRATTVRARLCSRTRCDRRWRDTLDHYDAIVARQLDRFRGRQVKTTGDGTLATFDGSACAIRCTIAIRDEVQSLGLELSSGLHAGEIELRGDDVTGIAVVIGQRVSALANGGEVLVSSTVKDLVAGAGIQFDNRTEQPLKGVPGTWQLYAVADI